VTEEIKFAPVMKIYLRKIAADRMAPGVPGSIFGASWPGRSEILIAKFSGDPGQHKRYAGVYRRIAKGILMPEDGVKVSVNPDGAGHPSPGQAETSRGAQELGKRNRAGDNERGGRAGWSTRQPVIGGDPDARKSCRQLIEYTMHSRPCRYQRHYVSHPEGVD
jgi:hypothetical protein